MYPDRNRTTRKDLCLVAAAKQALTASNGVCPFSLRIDGRLCKQFDGPVSVQTERPDATMIRTKTVGRLAEGLELTVDSTEYLDFPVYEYLITIRNVSSVRSALLTDLYACDVILPSISPILYQNNGDFCSPDGYRTTAAPLTEATETIHPIGGRPCDGAFPYFRILGSDTGYHLAIGWPGQWLAEFSAADHGFRFAAKQQYTKFRLLPGETYRAPRITLMAFSGGEDRAINLWRRWYLAHILPRSCGTALTPMLNMCHPAGDEEFTHATEENQLEAIDAFLARGFHPDIWWLDAGWYPCKDEEGVRRWWRTGDWRPDPERFPRGLGAIGKKCEENDIKFLLWFEPERIKLDYRPPELPEHFILYKEEERDGKRMQSDLGLLDLGNPECLAWLTAHVDRIIKDSHLAIYRQDFNFEPLEYWLQNDEPERLGMHENRHVQGYLAYWDALLSQNPGLLIDSCASGGRRNDLETMRRSVPLHPTDYGYGIPPTKQAFYDTLFTWIPFFRGYSDICGIKDGEYTNGAPEPRGVDSFALHHGISPALHCPCLCDTDDSFFTQIRTFADTVWRPAAEFLLTADYYSLIPPARTRCGWRAYAFHEPQTDKGFVHVIRSDQNKEDTQNLFLRFLTLNHTYRFHNPETGHSFFVDGGSATQSGIRFALEQRSGAIWFFAPTEGQ